MSRSRPSSTMDQDAPPEEAAEFERQRLEDQRYLDDIEQQIARVKEEDHNVFAGCNKHVVPFDYTGPEMERYRRRDQELRDSVPDYDEVVAFAAEAVRRNSALWSALRNSKDPPLEAYKLGFRLIGEKGAQYQRARPLSQSEIDGMETPEELEDRLAEQRSGTPQEEQGGYISRDERRLMNSVETPDVFEHGLDWLKSNKG